jgi:hypothetical protein
MSTKQTRTRGEDYQAPAPVPKIKRTQGRPEVWSETWITQAAFMARNGATDVEMAKELGCALSTFYLRMNQYPQFSEAVNAGKAAYDQRVSNSLARRAIGYEHETEKVFSNGLRVKVIEHVPPDTTAQIFWLKNRQPDLWRDRKETEIIVPDTSDEPGQIDARGAALAALALFNEAQYDPGATGMLLEATANAEETDDGEPTNPRGAPAADPDGQRDALSGDDDWGDEPAGYDIDPGEL